MAIEYGTPGYKYYRDENGRIYGLRNYWYARVRTGIVNGGPTMDITVKNDAVDGEWYNFNDFDYFGYGNNYMTIKADEKVKELNERDFCVIPCTCYSGSKRHV
jgi:hypothetical protein